MYNSENSLFNHPLKSPLFLKIKSQVLNFKMKFKPSQKIISQVQT